MITSSTFPCSNSPNFITTSRFHERLSMRHKCTNKIAKISFIFCKRDFEYIPNLSTSIYILFSKGSSMLQLSPIWPCNFSTNTCMCLSCRCNGISNICGDYSLNKPSSSASFCYIASQTPNMLIKVLSFFSVITSTSE